MEADDNNRGRDPEVFIGLSVMIAKWIRELYNLALSYTQLIGYSKFCSYKAGGFSENIINPEIPGVYTVEAFSLLTLFLMCRYVVFTTI